MCVFPVPYDRSLSLTPRAITLVFFMCLGLFFYNTQAQAQTQAESAQSAQYDALADLLDNKETRDQLVERLRTLATQPAKDPALVSPEADLLTGDRAGESQLSTTVALKLQTFASSLRRDIHQSWRVFSALKDTGSQPMQGLSGWRAALLNLFITILVVALVYAVCRVLAHRVFARLNAWATRPKRPQSRSPDGGAVSDSAHTPESSQGATSGNPSKRIHSQLGPKLMAALGALVVDVAVTAVAALAGYVAVLSNPASAGQGAILSTQFLTAFVAIEVIKACSRGVFATRYEQLRLLPISAENATYWNRWIVILISVTGYGLLVLVPLVKTVLSTSVGQLLGILLMTAVYIYAVRVVWKNRKSVSAELTRSAEHATTSVFGTLMRIAARSWAWLALAYLTVLLVVSLADQQHALSYMGAASLQTLVAVLVGAFLSMLLQSWMTRRLRLSERWRQAFPLLERRLNSYIPATLKALRLVVVIAVVLVVLDAWHVFDLALWLSSANGQAAINIVFRVAVVLLLATLTWTVLASIIEHRLSTAQSKHGPTEREKTLLMLFKNALAVLICTMTALVMLSQVGIDVAPLIAGAGVVGLAIGFGAQKLVQDVITGIFIQLENGLNQNDVVELAGLFGTVEKLTIRSVVVRTLDGGYHLIPFSSIDKVSNHTRDFGYHYGEYCVGLRESVDEVIAQMHLAFEALKKDPEVANAIIDDISIPGVTSINQQGYTIRVLIKTTPGMQWAVQRSFNRLIKMYFDAADIELPYPHTVLHFGRDKNGFAPPVDIRMVDAVAHREGRSELESAPGQTLRPLPDAS